MLPFFPANELAGYYKMSFQDKGFRIWSASWRMNFGFCLVRQPAGAGMGAENLDTSAYTGLI